MTSRSNKVKARITSLSRSLRNSVRRRGRTPWQDSAGPDGNLPADSHSLHEMEAEPFDPERTPDSHKDVSTITLRLPSVYEKAQATSTFVVPSDQWLFRTWAVTYSTLKMWHPSKNVKITYRPMKKGSTPGCLDDTVEHEYAGKAPFFKNPSTIRGVDTPNQDRNGSYTWRGRNAMKLITSHWEVLGWGEVNGSRWVVTWFQKTMFSDEGIDIYSDSTDKGTEEALYLRIVEALKPLKEDAPRMATFIDEMRNVPIA